MHAFLRECVLVEGKDDITALARRFQGLFFASQGLQRQEDIERSLATLAPRIGLIIFTDPDGPGEKIRARFSERIPEAKHARLSPKDCRHNNGHRLGIAYASPEAIAQALKKSGAHILEEPPGDSYDLAFLLAHSLTSGGKAKARRRAFCHALDLGLLDAKQTLAVLNSGAFSDEEIHKALEALS